VNEAFRCVRVLACLLAAALPLGAADTVAGRLSRDDWRAIRRQMGAGLVPEAQLYAQGDPVPQADAHFGHSVAVSGDTVVVGAPRGDNPLTADAGLGWVFVRHATGWHRQDVFWDFDGSAGDRLGASVAVAGDTMVVGAPFADPSGVADAGAAFVAVRTGNNWTPPRRIVAPDAAASDHFGWSVAVSADGQTIVVGAPDKDTAGGADAGAAYVFVRSGTTWIPQQTLGAAAAAAGDRLGASASLAGETLVLGAPDDDTPAGVDAGSAAVFVRTGTVWSEQQTLFAADGAAGDSFGHAVSVSADTAWVGAPDDDTAGGADAGSAYVFVRSGTAWTGQQKLLAADGAATDGFGASVSVSGETGVAGAASDDTPAGSAAGSAHVFTRSGTAWSEQQQLVASDGAAADAFGSAVAVEGDLVVAGAAMDEDLGVTDAGSAYAFVRSGVTWTEERRLGAWDNVQNAGFGQSISLSGDTLVVGSQGDSMPAGKRFGAAYVFVRSTGAWALQQKLFASDGAPFDYFGHSASVSGDTLVVGAPFHDGPGGADSGAAYVFVRTGTTWSQQAKLVASDGAANDLFAFSIALSADTVAVGSPYDDNAGGTNAGSSYAFVRSGTTWSEQQRLQASDAVADGLFGLSTSLSGDTLVSGAPYHDLPGGPDGGAAYVFVRSATTWTQQQRVLASDGEPGDLFGHAVAVADDTLVVGAAFGDATGVTDAGSAYVFARSGASWSEQQKLEAADAAAGDVFGGAVALSSNRIVIGAPVKNTVFGDDAGVAYLFGRSGPLWTEQERLLPPGGNDNAQFGYAVVTYGDAVAVSARQEKTPGDLNSGSVYLYRARADLAVTKSDGQPTAVPGEPITYTIVASNDGPGDVTSATVVDVLPPVLQAAVWTCVASPGSLCSASGSGGIADVVDLAAGGTATYTLTATVSSAATGSLSNTVTVTPSGGAGDPNPANDSATDVDVLTPQADVGLVISDSADPVATGAVLTYTLTATNHGPSDATSLAVVDALPSGVVFVSSVPGAPVCTHASGTVTCALGAVTAGSSATVTIDVTVAAAGGILVDTATASAAAQPDPDPANNAASESTAVGRRDGELAHRSVAVLDFAASPGPAADEDTFRISQKPRASYEVIVDATSGDVGASSGPALERLAPDGTTVLQESAAVGAGPSRSLRWWNASSSVVEGEAVRVRSTGCATDCGADDVYRIRAYETTYSVPRFNNSGSQVSVLVLQNRTDDTVSGEVFFTAASGAQVGVHAFTLAAKATLVLNTSTVPGVSGASGAITIAHDGGYAALSGKTVALEPAAGLAFDTPLEVRR
jgi:uncharacterized repeat protein (TIGR01451 family)